MIPLDLLVSLPGMLHKSMMIFAPSVLEKDDDAAVRLVIDHIKPYPVRCVIAKLHVTGDGFSVMCTLRCSPEKDEQREVTIDTSHSGVTVFELKRIWAVSMLGLFSLPTKLNEKKSVLVLPPPIKPENTTVLQQGLQLKPKPGGGFSEEHDMRAYQQGDPIRNIHWKASAKFDTLIIREPLVPPPNSRLVHIMPWKTIQECDLIMGRLRWVSDFLIKWEMPFFIKYGDDVCVSEITQEKDLVEFLCYVLSDSENITVKMQQVSPRFSMIFRIDAGQTTENIKQEVIQ